MENVDNLTHYVEFFYPYNPDVANSRDETSIKKVPERNPLLLANNEYNNKIGFHFFDVNQNNNPFLKENRINISSTYYYGEYLTADEITYIHEIMPYTKGINRMIKCFCGYLVTHLTDEDTTIQEYINNLNAYKKIKRHNIAATDAIINL